MNAMVGEKMSIITNKPQTTRHRIIGIVSKPESQIVFSDTPGIISDPAYKMQEAMNRFVASTFEDADLMLFVTDTLEKYEEDDPIITRLKRVKIPLFLLINKTDLSTPDQILKRIQWWNDKVDFKETIPIAAINAKNVDTVLKLIVDMLPEGPVYYPKDQLTDRNERFFISEIIREKILLFYHQEIPYSCEVMVTNFKHSKTNAGAPIVRIAATIFVARDSQKNILIGKGGSAIKKLGAAARKDMEAWLDSKVFLEMHVKVKNNWRDDDRMLKHFGY